jgi:hypothetical protein
MRGWFRFLRLSGFGFGLLTGCSGWAFLEVLDYLGTLSLLLAVVSYLSVSTETDTK